ncbi:uncharacterized protein LOC117332988 [Pecten maximus]|uniref:uncharacterized protein LOC117332988 n=1 Tax=Pecten maximus TaxID=6579 RepID=UPI0014580EEF|nr:uncharacterized protein LOC117332988 [Pecten maximus]
MDQNQNANIQYHFAQPTGEIVEGADPGGGQPVVALQRILDNQQVIYTTNEGDGHLQVYHHDASQAIQGLEGQDTIVFLDEGMEVETETEVATASEAVEAVKYIDHGENQMQKIIIQVAPQDQEVRQEPQRIVIPGLENYVVQLAEQDQTAGNVHLYQNIQPKTVYPKVAIKGPDKTAHKSQPLILKPPQIIQQSTSQSTRPEATGVGQSDTSQQPKVVISQKQVKHQKKRPTPQNENTEYIYVSRVLASSKDETSETGKSVYNTIKVYKSMPKKVDEKQTEGMSSQQGRFKQVAPTPESEQKAANSSHQVTPPSQKVTPPSQQMTVVEAPSQQVTVVEAPPQQMTVVEAPPQQVTVMEAPSQQVTVVEAQSQQVTVVEASSQQMTVVEAPPQQVTEVEAPSQQVAERSQHVSEIPHQTEETLQQLAVSTSVQEMEMISKQSSQQLQSGCKSYPKSPRIVSVLGASKNIIRKGGNIFKVDPVSKKIIFEPPSPEDTNKVASLEGSLKDLNSENADKINNHDDEESDVDDEEEPVAKAKPYENLERVTTGKRKGSWKKKPKSKKNKSQCHFNPKDVAPPPKQPTKSKKQDKTKGKKLPKDKSNSKSMFSLDPDIQIKQEVVEEDSEMLPKQKTIEEEEEELEDKKCRMCLALHNAECPLMRRRVRTSIGDNVICLNSTMLSLQTIPKEFILSRRDGHGLSVFASDIIVKGTHFGPLVGEKMTFEEISHKMDFTHLWLIETEETISAVDKKKIKYNFISTYNEMTSNWCRYLRPTLNAQECNVISYCKNEEILFVAREDIQEGEELIVYFRFIEDLHNELWFADLCNRVEKLCKRCDVVYTNLVSYVKHVQVFHPYSLKKLKAICKECGLVLESTGELTTHCKEEHQGNGAFICKDCGKQFPIPRGLHQHRKFFHIIEGNFPCEHCGKCFFNKFKLKNHMRNKHSGKEHKCNVCKKVVGSQNALNRHRKSHTREGYKFTCDRCGKSCRDNSNLRSHMLTHVKARKFPCTVAGCVMRYGSKVALQMHYAKTHLLSAEQIKVHMINMTNPEEQNELDHSEQENMTGVFSGTQTEIVYELESENDEWSDYV